MTVVRALRFDHVGPPQDVLRVAEVDVGDPGPGRVAVAMEASPVDPSDLWYVQGAYGLQPTLPDAGAGQSGVGRVVALGDAVKGLAGGDRVLIMPTGEQQVWQERVNVESANVVAIDGDADAVALATVGVNQMTAFQLLEGADLRPGDWIAQTAANSAVGRSVIALARRRGLRTVNIVRRPDAVALVDDRADVVLVDDEKLGPNLARALGSAELALVLAATGSGVTPLIQALRHSGRVISYGAADRQPMTVPNLIFGDHHVNGFWIVNWLRGISRGQAADAYRVASELTADGVLTSETSTVPFDEVSTWVQAAQDPTWPAKVVLTF